MYRGTYDGDKEEMKFVAQFNSNKNKFIQYISNFGEPDGLWLVRVTTKQLSKLSGKKVFTRSDCYLAKISKNIQNILDENDYYLSEEILDKNNIVYVKIQYSGISIKMTMSMNFQILKTGPNSFKSLFNSYELGAGASLFCMRESELEKNINLIVGWNTTVEKMTSFFDSYTNGNINFHLDQEICKKIKNYSCAGIKEIIEHSTDLQKKIFNGIGLYEEPYTAFYFYHGNNITELTTIPFNVTTGSGRSKGDYTIVLKPYLKGN